MIDRYTLPAMGAIWTEQNRWQKILDVELAVCQAHEEAGNIPAGATESIRKKARFDVKRIQEIENTTRHDVIAFLTNVAEHVGDNARHIHVGLTSSDVLDTGYALQMKQAAELIDEELHKLLKVFQRQAIKYKHTPQMGRSHGIHAEPTTFGLKMLLYYAETKRNLARLEAAYKTISVGKISGAVGTFSNIEPEIEARACELLGLDFAPVSTQIIQRDRYAEFMATLSIIGASLEKFATEVRHLQRTEVLEAEEYFGKGQKGSSAMPHKRNPITCERLCGLARLLRGNAHTALENVALWHERDISHSSVERVIVPDSCIVLHYMLSKSVDLFENLLVYPERMMEVVRQTGGLFYSQRVLLALVEAGMSRDDAYATVQRNAMKVWQQKADFKLLLKNDPDVTQRLSAAKLDELFDLNYLLRNVDKIYQRLGIE